MFPREEKFFLEESQETVQNIRELLQLKLREQDIWQLCHTFRTNFPEILQENILICRKNEELPRLRGSSFSF